MISIELSKVNPFEVSLKKAWFVSATELKAKFSYKEDATVKVYGIDLSHIVDGINYVNPVIPKTLFLHQSLLWWISTRGLFVDGTVLRCLWGQDMRFDDIGSQSFPYYFYVGKGEKETDEPALSTLYVPAPETAQAFVDRLMPYLHEAALTYVKQSSHAVAHVTGNARKILNTVRHADSINRHSSTNNRYRLPIGYAARELLGHLDDTSGLTRNQIEQLVWDIHSQFVENGDWWDFHLSHDFKYWHKQHNVRRVLLDRPDGRIEVLYDIDANVRKNLPKESRDKKAIEQQGEIEFGSLATDWFNQALYATRREAVTEREMTYQLKEK